MWQSARASYSTIILGFHSRGKLMHQPVQHLISLIICLLTRGTGRTGLLHTKHTWKNRARDQTGLELIPERVRDAGRTPHAKAPGQRRAPSRRRPRRRLCGGSRRRRAAAWGAAGPGPRCARQNRPRPPRPSPSPRACPPVSARGRPGAPPGRGRRSRAGPAPRGRPGLASAMRRGRRPQASAISSRQGGAAPLPGGLSSAPGRRRPRLRAAGPPEELRGRARPGAAWGGEREEERCGLPAAARGAGGEPAVCVWVGVGRPALTVRPLQGILGPLEVHRHDGGGLSSQGGGGSLRAPARQPARPEREGGRSPARADVGGSGNPSLPPSLPAGRRRGRWGDREGPAGSRGFRLTARLVSMLAPKWRPVLCRASRLEVRGWRGDGAGTRIGSPPRQGPVTTGCPGVGGASPAYPSLEGDRSLGGGWRWPSKSGSRLVELREAVWLTDSKLLG